MLQLKCPSLSVGVLHHGRTMFTQGFGYASKAMARVPDSRTVYSVGCCINSVAALILNLLEQAERVASDQPLSDACSEIQKSNPKFREEIDLADLLSHGTGLAALPYAVRGINGSVLPQQKDVPHIFARLPSTSDLRSQWHYNQWSDALAAYLIDKHSHMSFVQCIDDLLGRLCLTRTYAGHTPDDNYARAHVVLPGGVQSEEAELRSLEASNMSDRAGSLRTCVADMLRWCNMLIKASNLDSFLKEDVLEEDSLWIYPVSSYDPDTLTEARLMKALWTIQQPGFLIDPSDPSQTYGMGLYSFTLPTPLFNTVTSKYKVNQSYVLGAKSDKRKVIGHTGDLGAFTSAYWVFPETKSAVVVLTNASSANGDPSHLVAQVLIQALFDLKPAINFTRVAADMFSNAQLQWQQTVKAWSSHRLPNTNPKPLDAYIGEYSNKDLRMHLSISPLPPDGGPDRARRMQLRINDLADQVFELYHYDTDRWTFLPRSRDECLKRGLASYIGCWRTFVLNFGQFANDRCQGVKWRLDPHEKVTSQLFRRTDKEY